MGFFDFFKNKKEIPNNQNQKSSINKDLKFEVDFVLNDKGMLQVDFYDKDKKDTFKQFYDTTRLIILNDRTIAGKQVQDCLVSWYGEDDAIMIDNDGHELGRRVDYKKIIAQIDKELLLNDPNYCRTVMKGLLNKKRIEEYLEIGMQEDPEIKRGEYIGGVVRQDGKYSKVFDTLIGRTSHDSDRMKNLRTEKREREENKKQEEILRKKLEIEKLKNEIEDLEEDREK